MCRITTTRIFLVVALALYALNLGCGGGAEVSSNISPTSSVGSTTAPQMRSPVLGFVYTGSGSEVRAINGIPGSSTLGSPLALPAGVTGMAFAPGQEFALVEGASGASIGVISFSGTTPGSLVQIPGAVSRPGVISFSPNGASAALYSASEGRLQVLTGLPNQPQLTREIGSSDLPDAVRLLVIADDGTTLLEGTVNNAVYLLASGGAQLLENVQDLEGMVFTPQSNDALIFDRGAGTLSLLQGVSTVRSNRLLASGLTGLEGQVELQTDGGRAVLTSASANHLWEVDLQSLQVQDLQLPTAPGMLQHLRLSGQYLLSWQSGQPAWILNASQEKGSVYFVPAAAQAGTALLR